MSGPLIFDKYEVIRRLAVGGMGEIFLARQTGVVDRLVILKSLLPSLAEDADSISAFLDEARVAAKLNHPNIIGIYEVGRWEGTYFIAMEYVDGENLAVLALAAAKADVMIPCPIAARIVHGAALGLDFAHHAIDEVGRSLHVIHRDVTPQNIMLRTDGMTKVVDFGIAMAANRASQTATGVVKGKIGYMPPEQIIAEELDARSDQFSLGVVFWELCTGFRLFKKGKNELEIAQRIVHEEVPAPSSIVHQDFPRELDGIILRMLSKHRESRFPRCRDVAVALEDYLREHPRDGSPEAAAAFMKSLVGEQLRARTADLTSSPNFLISFARSREEVAGAQTSAEIEAPDFPPIESTVTQPRPRVSPLSSLPPEVPAVRGTGRSRTALALTIGTLIAIALLAFTLTGVLRPRMDPIPPSEPLEDDALFSNEPLPDPPKPPAAEAAVIPAAIADEATPEAAGAAGESARPSGDERRRPRERSRHEPREKRVTEEAPAPDEDGFLTLKTNPWAKVSIAGVPYGSTPVFKLRLPAGRHELHLVNEQAGVDVRRTVTIAGGETKKLSLDLQ